LPHEFNPLILVNKKQAVTCLKSLSRYNPREIGDARFSTDNPFPDPNAPLILVSPELFAAGGTWTICQRQNFSIAAREQSVVQRILVLFLRRLLNCESVT
jgi:hypothetical protein